MTTGLLNRSNSHHVDQGNLDIDLLTAAKFIHAESQSHPGDQGNYNLLEYGDDRPRWIGSQFHRVDQDN